MKSVYLLLILTILFAISGNAQSQKQLIKVGDQLYAEGDFYGASKWYKDAMNIDSTNTDVIYKYAESLRLYNDYAKAEGYYNKINKIDMGRTYPMATFWYPTMLKYNGKYNEAKKFFKRSKRFFQKDKKGFYYLKVNQEIKSCDEAIKLKKDSLSIEVKNMGSSINTYNSELGATLLNDSSIIYSSLRDEKMKNDNEITDTTYYLVKLFKASKHGDIWLTDNKLDEIINEKGFHIANGCINSEGTIFYYNKCDKNMKCSIYAIPFNNNTLGKPYEVEAVNSTNYTTTQPFITKINNKEVLFFSSNRDGGEGLMDIWYSTAENGKFNKPINAGKKINSIEDEITPFYDVKDSLLYFSSNWHEGLGGFDIFSTKTDLKSFASLKNLGYPINTSTNDFYYSIINHTALLTSNRKGSYTKKGETCCNDVYYYEIPDTIKTVFTTLEELNRYLPVKLYFHNDCPNPRSRDTLTTLNYVSTYKDYDKLYNEYKKEYSNGLDADAKEDALVDIEDLFSSYIQKGAKDLEMFTPLLIKELDAGKQVTLTIKGYASPLSKSDYNVNLTLRRISSLINYLSEYENGKILPYINGTAANSGKLTFVKVPFGEYQSKEISDNLDDKRNSVYSPGAAMERKIEIIAVMVSNAVQTTLDGSELEKFPILNFTDSLLTMNSTDLQKTFTISNTGEVSLKLFVAEFNQPGFEIIFSNNSILPSETSSITIKRNDLNFKGNLIITLLTNCIPNRISKKIYIKE